MKHILYAYIGLWAIYRSVRAGLSLFATHMQSSQLTFRCCCCCCLIHKLPSSNETENVLVPTTSLFLARKARTFLLERVFRPLWLLGAHEYAIYVRTNYFSDPSAHWYTCNGRHHAGKSRCIVAQKYRFPLVTVPTAFVSVHGTDGEHQPIQHSTVYEKLEHSVADLAVSGERPWDLVGLFWPGLHGPKHGR